VRRACRGSRRWACRRVLHLDLDLLLVEPALAQQLAKFLARLLRGVRAHEGVEHALLGRELGARGHFLAHALAGHGERYLHEVARDLLDVAADVADLGELGRLDLQERRLCQLGEAARDLGLADAGRADHQDVLGQHLLAQGFRQLLAAPAVAERDRDGALGIALAHDMAVELGDDLAGTES
jgi:hypothetical protein